MLLDVTSNVQTQLDGKQASLGYTPLDTAGGTMTGPLTLAEAPATDLAAATKKYVDDTLVVLQSTLDTTKAEAVSEAALHTDNAVKAMPYDLTAMFFGTPVQGQEIARIVMVRACKFPSGMGESLAVARAAALTGAQFELRKNGVTFGTMAFAEESSIAGFSSEFVTEFARNDIFTIVAVTPVDTAIADIAMTFAANLSA